ncbi:tumor necrosis factor receptor superfamily member 18 isoform X2 [Siphateles boraxobius]|uniref:tumor necrosis factor receptor superfamily member 18 isoform X2 n=1 Tax=Siphateles boraxobius TaxID=180520 RepID=UPI004063B09A
MDTAKLWFTLLCVCGSWISTLAINCDWTTEYEIENKCCKACPSGEYPKGSCQAECEKCPKNPALEVKCFCNNHLCLNEKCSSCEKRTSCKPGQQLNRTGDFDYNYTCVPCPDNTYNDAEDSRCKSITKCVGGVIFPGNKTHNARCVSSVTRHPTDKQENGIQSHPFMVACLIVTVLTCFVFIMYTAFQIFKYKMLLKLRKPCTRVLPSDTCSCKLSKEEMGDAKTEVSEEYSKSVMSTAFLESL